MIRVWRYSIVRPKALFLASQCMLLTAVLSGAAWGYPTHSLAVTLSENAGLILLLLTLQICARFSGLEAVIVAPNARLFVTRIGASLAMALLLLLPLFLAFPNLFPGYAGGVTVVVLSTLVLFGLRPLLYWLIKHKRFVEGLLILGSGELARKFCNELVKEKNTDANKSPHTATLLSTGSDHGANIGGESVVINFDELRELTLRDRVSRIVVAEEDTQSSESLAVALLDCKLRGLEVEQAVESYEKLSGKIWLEALRTEWLVYSEGFNPSKCYFPVKRLVDTLCASLLLLLSAPLFALIAVLIKLDSSGPVFFRQVRVGLHGKEFVLFKFRTMRQNAEQGTGPVWACENDQRVTGIGKFLRQFRLDELPQAINVLRGEMSLVGPRPERPYFVELLDERIPYYGLRHRVMPGITGWAQVLYPYGASIEDSYEKLQYDLYYAKHMSLRFDLRILLSTIKVVLFGRGR